MSLAPDRRRRRKAEVNIVPLVDVLTTLIFFFLITMQFKDLQTMNITLPDIETAGKNVLVEQIEVSVTADGKFFFNGTDIQKEQLPELLKMAAASAPRKLPVLLMADEGTELKNVTFAMDACRKSGLEDIRLQSR